MHFQNLLTLVLLNPDMPCLWKQCRSRSEGVFRSQLIWIYTVCHKLCQFASTTWVNETDWLKITSGRGILIYLAWHGFQITLGCELFIGVLDFFLNCWSEPMSNKAFVTILYAGTTKLVCTSKQPLRKHAYSNILKIVQPKTGKISRQNWWNFSYFCSKHRLWVLVRTALSRRF